MEQILDAVAYGLLIIVSLVAFAALLRFVVPTFVLKVRHSVDKSLGRGLKTYKYPTGRAVLYEPHPSLRKYVNEYLLFVNDGYKYFKCTVDNAVKRLDLEIIMLNNKNEVVDVLRASSLIDATSTSPDILLHPDTSYVALNVEMVNGAEVKRLTRSYYTLLQIGIYFSIVFTLALLELNAVSALTVGIFKIILGIKSVTVSTALAYFTSSFMIAALATLIVVSRGYKKGIEVVLNGKK